MFTQNQIYCWYYVKKLIVICSILCGPNDSEIFEMQCILVSSSIIIAKIEFWWFGLLIVFMYFKLLGRNMTANALKCMKIKGNNNNPCHSCYCTWKNMIALLIWNFVSTLHVSYYLEIIWNCGMYETRQCLSWN